MTEKATFVHTDSGKRRVLQLKHATPEKLVLVFGLREPPQLLTRADTQEVVFAEGSPEQPYSDLEPGAEYEFSTVQLDQVSSCHFTDGKSKKAPAPAMPPRLSDKLGMDDIQRAMMCCQAIYQDGPKKVVQFLNKPENLCLHNFGEVCVSRYGRLTYMLAETEDKDDLFIAFRGTESYEDILSDLTIWQGSIEGSPIAGKCHSGFLKLASCFPVDPILRKYVYSRGADDCARIVVCGHSMGGAVAHIVTLNMLSDLQRCSRDTENVLSIAIGAPFFGDREMRKYAEKHDLSDNLLTIVNQNDPVPRLLQLAEAFQCATKAGAKKVQGIVNGTLPILKMSLQALSCIFGGPAIANAAAAVAAVDQLPTYLEDISQSVRSHMKALDDTLQYTPLGWYMLITHFRPPGTGQKNQWHVSYIEAAEEVLQAMGETWKSEWSTSKLKEHKISQYASVYPKTTLQGGRTEFPVEREAARAREVVQYNPFVLTIEAVSLTIIGPEGSRKQKKLRIRINGKHFDFFVLGETTFTGIRADMQKGIQTAVNDDEVTLECELKEGILFDGVPKVHITTHFDVTDIQIDPGKIKGLEFLDKDIDVILGHKPFQGSKMLKNATETSQREALRRCQMACDLFEIRQHMQKSCFVGLFGPQNAGKSTLIEKVWDVAVPESEKGYRAHTTVPRLYKARGTDRMVIIDFPGTNAIDKQVANLANRCGGLSSILILVMPFLGYDSTDHVAQLEKARALADRFKCTIILCISRCGLYKVALKDKETTDAYREDYVKHLNIDPANILFTELVESVDDLESRGIVGPEGVRNWLKDWLIKYDVFEDDEDELYAAVNMTRR